MRTSEQTDAVAPAWRAALTAMPDVERDGRGNYGTYSTIAAVLDTIRPVLDEHGLSIQQSFADSSDDTVKIVTRVWHDSGQWIEDDGLVMHAPIEPQKRGSVITYGRRYALTTFCALATEDDDAASAQPTQPSRPPQRHTAPPQPQPRRALVLDTIDGDAAAVAAVIAALNNAPDHERAAVKRKFLDDVGAPPNAVDPAMLPFAVQWCIEEQLLDLGEPSYVHGDSKEADHVGAE